MNSLNKRVAVALLAGVALMAAAGSASAAVLLSFEPVGSAATLKWTESGTKGGSISSTATDTVSVTMPGVKKAINATLVLSGTGSDKSTKNGTQEQQLVDSGTFELTANKAFKYDGTTEAKGTVLLEGAFIDGVLEGTLGGSLASFDVAMGDVTSLTSSLFTLGSPATDAFTLALNNVVNNVGGAGPVLNGKSFESFKADASGTFTGTLSAVPEPASWAMILVGFGGLGMAMRAQRKKPALAAVA